MSNKIYIRKSINKALHVIECPKCKGILASASERNLLPVFSSCPDCDYEEHKSNELKNK